MRIIVDDPNGTGSFMWVPVPRFDKSLDDIEKMLRKLGFDLKPEWQFKIIEFNQDQIMRLLNILTLMVQIGPGMPFVQDAILSGLSEIEKKVLFPIVPLNIEPNTELTELFAKIKENHLKWNRPD